MEKFLCAANEWVKARVRSLLCAARRSIWWKTLRIVRAESVIVIIILCLNNKYSREICERRCCYLLVVVSHSLGCKPVRAAYLCLYNSIHPKISGGALFVNNVVWAAALFHRRLILFVSAVGIGFAPSRTPTRSLLAIAWCEKLRSAPVEIHLFKSASEKTPEIPN